MITFSISQEYLILASVILFLFALVWFLKYMAEISNKTDFGGEEPVIKIKEKTIFLEDKINELIKNKDVITRKEWNKVNTLAAGFKALSGTRLVNMRNCQNFVFKLERHLKIRFGDDLLNDEFKNIIEQIKETNIK